MVGVDGGSLQADSQPKSVCLLGLRVGSCLALSLHSSHEPSELSQWSCHEDSTINIVIVITIIEALLCLSQDDY